MQQERRNETDIKNWLFQENMRLEDLRHELSRASSLLREEADCLKRNEQMLAQEREKFSFEKEEFKVQMQDWTDRIRQERKKLEEEQSFFDKKFKILETGFKQLDADRKTFEAKKRAFEYQKYEYEQRGSEDFQSLDKDGAVETDSVFFRGVTHPLALKKRYKDLIKIYHPDNLCGDKTVLQQINREYEQLKKVITYQKKA